MAGTTPTSAPAPAAAPGKQTTAVTVMHGPVQEVKHTMKAAHLLYSAPNFVLRGPIYICFLIVFAGLGYSFWGKKNETVTCQLELKRDVTKIQAPTGGYISQVYVTEGSQVGEVTTLVEIQFKTTASAQSERERLTEKLDRLKEDISWRTKSKSEQEARIQGLKRTLQEEIENEKKLRTENVETDTKLFEAQLDVVKANTDALQKQRDQYLVRVTTAQRQAGFSKDEAEKAERQYNEEKALFEKKQSTIMSLDAAETKKNAARKVYQDSVDAVMQAQTEVAKLDLELSKLKAEPDRLRNLERSKELTRSAQRTAVADRISNLRFQIESMTTQKEEVLANCEQEKKRIEGLLAQTNQLKGVYWKDDICEVQSTYSGVVANVYVKPGQQIAAGEVLFAIVRDIEPLYAQVLVQNKDIGRVQKNMEVGIKYAAYPYQDYGIQLGTITAKRDRPSDVKGQESVYVLKVTLDRVTIGEGNKKQNLSPGLLGLADIKVGEQRLIETVFKPVHRFLNPDD